MPRIKHNTTIPQKRAKRVRSKINGTSDRPRLAIVCSNANTYLQVINDETGQTLASSNDLHLNKTTKETKGTKTERAQKVAQDLAAKLKKQNITKLMLDRGARRYHGRVKAVADTIREAGIHV